MMVLQFSSSYLFSTESKEHCMNNLKKVQIPSFYGKTPKTTAAVLIPLCAINGTVALIYTIRAKELRSHSGQTAFPGGKTDQNENAQDTALRETEEEIGIERQQIDVWGNAPSFPGRDNKILITPVIGVVDLKLSNLKLNKEEVQGVFTVPLNTLCDPKNQFHTQFRNGIVLPVFLHERHRIWGITAYITHVFLSCLLPKEVYRNDWMNKRIVKNMITDKL